MAENKYVGGIQINTSGFEVKASAPVDSRFRVKNAEGLLELLTYEGLVSYNEADKKYYRFADGEWKALSVNTPAELEALIKGLIATETTGAMEFKGATASLPENPGKGDMYKVSGQFAVGEETAKVGDTIVYNGEQWFLIPSGDDIEDTWRPVKVGENTLDQTETLEFVAGENVTITENAGKVTISSSYEDTHYESKLVVGNEVTDASDENVVENGNVRLNLVEDGVVKSSHKIVGAGGITVTHTKAEGEDGENVITIEAPAYEGSNGEEITVGIENGKITASLTDAVHKLISDNTDAIGDLADYVGIIPSKEVEIEGEKVDVYAGLDVVGYINKVAEETLAAAQGGSSETAASVKQQLDNYKSTNDTRVKAIEDDIANNRDAWLKDDNDNTTYQFSIPTEGDDKGKLLVEKKEIGETTWTRVDAYDFTTPDELAAALANYYNKGEVDGLIQGVKDIVNGLDESITTVTEGTGIKVTDAPAGNDHAYTVELDTEGAKTALGLDAEGIAAYVTVESLNATAKGYADAVEAKIPTELGVMSVGQGNDAIEIGGTDATPTVGVKLNPTQGNVILSVDGGLKAQVDLSHNHDGQYKKIQTAVVDPTASGNSLTFIDSITQDAQGVITATKKTVGKVAEATHADTAIHADAATKVDAKLTVKVGGATVEYDGSEAKTADVDAAIKAAVDAIPEAPVYSLKKAADSGAYAAVYNLTRDGEIVGDTINIPKDMVVESGKVVENPVGQTAGTYIELKLQNVTNPLYINVGSLIEYVTSGSKADDAVIVAVDSDHKVTATLTDGKITLAKLEKDVQDAIALAKTALQAADITGKADKVTGAVAGNFAGLDANGNLTDSGINAEDLWDKQENLVNFNGKWTVAENGAMSSTTGGITLGDRTAVYTQLNGTCFKIVSEAESGETVYGFDSISRKNGTFTLPAETGTLLTDKDEKIGALRDSIVPADYGTIATDGWAFGTNLTIGHIDDRIYLNKTNKTIMLDSGGNGQTTYGQNKISLWASTQSGNQSGELTLPYKTGALVVDSDLDAYALKKYYDAQDNKLKLTLPNNLSAYIGDGSIDFKGDSSAVTLSADGPNGKVYLTADSSGINYRLASNSSNSSIATEHVAFVDRIKVGIGLKAETKTNATDFVKERHISIDEEVVFVLDCN